MFLELISRDNFLLRHLSKDFSRWKVFRNVSANFSKQFHHQFAAGSFMRIWVESLNILSKAQINQVQDVHQKLTLHRPNSITKAMDGLIVKV